MRTIILNLKLLFVLAMGTSNIGLQGQDNTMRMETAIFGSGCFWCTEAIFDRLAGVEEVISGYSGGVEKNPNYEMICSGETNYAEVTKIIFDSDIISFQELLEVFWQTHDPTTLNKQGADVGPQYRSVIFYLTDEQRKTAEYFKKELDDAKIWAKPIVTEISPYTNFYPAEKYHQDYYYNNPSQGYCNFVITPKIQKFEKIFSDKLKKNTR